MRFADTNVLLYAISTDPAEQEKRRRAAEILGERDLRISVQVLQEFYVQATRAGRPDPLAPDQARRLVESFLRFEVVPTTVEVVRAAIATSARFGISYWDAAIVEAARAAGCGVVLTEDLADGQDYAGVTVTNPFATG